MTRERYAEDESMNRIVRIFQGKDPPSNDPNTLSGEVLSTNVALSDLVELLGGSMPNEAMANLNNEHLFPGILDSVEDFNKSRKKVLEIADYIVPGHGKMFKVKK